MPTPIRSLLICDRRTTLTRTLTAAAMGVAVGMCATVAAMQYVPIIDDTLVYRLLRAGCKFPALRGEAATWAIGSDGEINCWEQRDGAK